jgi:hypothetical protein
LGRLVYVSQCQGLPTPSTLSARAGVLDDRKRAFLARVKASRLASDLEQAIREDQETSRYTHEGGLHISSGRLRGNG